MADQHCKASPNQSTESKRTRRRSERENIGIPARPSSEIEASPDRPNRPPHAAGAGDSLSTNCIHTPPRRPKAEVESMIGAAIEARRRQYRQLERCNAALASAETSPVAKVASATGGSDEDGKELNDDAGCHFEYLDHTADVQLHSWGGSLERALEAVVVAMFGYMTDLRRVECRPEARTVRVRAHDATSLVFRFLQEWLSLFHESGFVARRVRVAGSVNRTEWTVEATATGEEYDPSRHTQGTEVKAVTYGSLKVIENESSDSSRCDIWVIVDI